MTSEQRATTGYVAPFTAYVVCMAVERASGLPSQFAYPIRCALVALLILLVSRPYLSLRPKSPVASVLLGVAVFLIWIGPDVLFHYRQFWLFENSLTGKAASSVSDDVRRSLLFQLIRVGGSVALVPILEELFWRGWMMRWLIRPNFRQVRFGEYAPMAFWTVAVLFASEHGAYWEVGLAAGILYNWWAVRTRSLADCILAHATTNGVLSAYVLLTNQWQYWL